MRRNWLPLTLMFLVLAGLGLFAYMSQHPESALWERARRLPGVGEFVADWHWHYKVEKQRAAGTRARSPEGADGAVIEDTRYERVTIPSVERPASRRSSGGGGAVAADDDPFASTPAHVWVVPGIEIRAAPRTDARLVHTMTAIANLRFSERRGDYFHVHHEKYDGWIFLPAYDAGDAAKPPLGSAAEPPGPLAPRDPDAKLLAEARALLGDKERVGRLGPYDFYTDSRDPALESLLATLAAQVEPQYEARYGRIAAGEAKGAVVLFALEGGYRVFQLKSESLRGLSSSGHNSQGVVALYQGERPSDEVGATLVHELTHLMNRRAIGPALPSWLDEGLCEDLAFAKIGPGGQLAPAEIGGRTVRSGSTIEFTGPLSSFFRLRAQLLDHKLPTLLELAALDWSDFVHAENRRGSYDLAGAWMRYLLDGENGKRAPAFRSFLHSVAAGGQPDTQSLFASLQDDREVVEAGFRVWLLDRANQLLGPP